MLKKRVKKSEEGMVKGSSGAQWSCRLEQPSWQTVGGFCRNLEKNPVILVGVSPKERKSRPCKDVGTPCVWHNSSWFLKYGNNPSVCGQMSGWRKCVRDHGVVFSLYKGDLDVATAQLHPEDTLPSEISQVQKKNSANLIHLIHMWNL